MTDAPSSPSILLVEDNPADVRLAEEVLREVGLVKGLRVARTGEQALRMLRGEGEHAAEPLPSLILLDLNLPGRSGREVLADIKQDPRLRRIPVIIVSTSSAPTDVLGCYDAHANCYITKPMNLNDFFAFAEALRAFWFQWARLPHSASEALGAG
jgi:CheY-like chemotaxis protein